MSILIEAAYDPGLLFRQLMRYKKDALYDIVVYNCEKFGIEIEFLPSDTKKKMVNFLIEKLRNAA